MSSTGYLIEVDVRAGLPAFTFSGMRDLRAREVRERVRAAILNSGREFPLRRTTITIVPSAERRADLPGLDVAVAAGILAATGEIRGDGPTIATPRNLSLDGTLSGPPVAMRAMSGQAGVATIDVTDDTGTYPGRLAALAGRMLP